ncbi:hypothetical protein Acr_15g0019390 [Actinidia rufa]|uniref:Uncharacterized protein n=1 Tax=Actinidia rufa TaxID=165716 RepID=A0A7J0FXA7_9ERIC|nr:hypothetical protein Acr_15g0019390 [Actinidia rufa]
MGNCLDVFDGGEEEFKTTATFESMTSHLYQGYKPARKGDDENCRGRKVKIVVTREQLELLLRSVEFQSQLVGTQSVWGRRRSWNWRPSLATIAE